MKFRLSGEVESQYKKVIRVAKPKLRTYYPPIIVGSLSAGAIQSVTDNFFLFAWQWWILIVPIFLVWLWLCVDDEKEIKSKGRIKDVSNT
jgi:hypothetical protein